MSVADSFKEHGVIPDVVHKAPEQLLEVSYGSNRVDLGKALTPTQVKDRPRVQWKADSNAFYTLIMTDPDAPSRQNPTVGQVKHWLVINVPGDQVEKGDTLAEYRGSGPPQGTGLHRYVFLVYKQPQGRIQEPDHGYIDAFTRDGRLKWNAEQFVAKHSLEGPIAGNFYQAEFDDYVPILQAQTKPMAQ